jgi:hypothetical protein
MRHTIPKGKYMGIAFDGTSRLGEAINVCVRYISDDFHIEYRLVMFATTAKHVNNQELAGLITTQLMKTLQVENHENHRVT